ncbi:hypothetical protein O3P69_014604 [Scylla paramamosain]|uniref:Uncharacterized protein n=1 Tax=Scylla paramamosain TaxID=85552 RepID=A0AAW0U1U1_SCYPA
MQFSFTNHCELAGRSQSPPCQLMGQGCRGITLQHTSLSLAFKSRTSQGEISLQSCLSASIQDSTKNVNQWKYHILLLEQCGNTVKFSHQQVPVTQLLGNIQVNWRPISQRFIGSLQSAECQVVSLQIFYSRLTACQEILGSMQCCDSEPELFLTCSMCREKENGGANITNVMGPYPEEGTEVHR